MPKGQHLGLQFLIQDKVKLGWLRGRDRNEATEFIQSRTAAMKGKNEKQYVGHNVMATGNKPLQSDRKGGERENNNKQRIEQIIE